jgi:hypothetical protein
MEDDMATLTLGMEYTSAESLKIHISADQYWSNTAPLGSKPAWIILPKTNGWMLTPEEYRRIVDGK